MMEPRVRPRVGVVGVGYWGQNLARNFYEISALEAVCDADRGRLDAASQKYGCRTTTSYAELLADPGVGAVAIATPAEMHAAMVRDALAAGKDVFVEKPLCLSVREGAELVALAARK